MFDHVDWLLSFIRWKSKKIFFKSDPGKKNLSGPFDAFQKQVASLLAAAGGLDEIFNFPHMKMGSFVCTGLLAQDFVSSLRLP